MGMLSIPVFFLLLFSRKSTKYQEQQVQQGAIACADCCWHSWKLFQPHC